MASKWNWKNSSFPTTKWTTMTTVKSSLLSFGITEVFCQIEGHMFSWLSSYMHLCIFHYVKILKSVSTPRLDWNSLPIGNFCLCTQNIASQYVSNKELSQIAIQLTRWRPFMGISKNLCIQVLLKHPCALLFTDTDCPLNHGGIFTLINGHPHISLPAFCSKKTRQMSASSLLTERQKWDQEAQGRRLLRCLTGSIRYCTAPYKIGFSLGLTVSFETHTGTIP